MEINLSELLTSFNSILTEITAENNFVVMVTMQHKLSKPIVQQGSRNKFEHQ
jgi:ABC-type branched-subunit amino acid transport system substrate-binding protein